MMRVVRPSTRERAFGSKFEVHVCEIYTRLLVPGPLLRTYIVTWYDTQMNRLFGRLPAS